MAETQGTTAKPKVEYEMVEHNGQMVRKYPNGDLRGAHGHIVGQSPQRARELALKRKEQGTVIARKAIRKYTQSETYQDGLEKLVGKRVEVAMTDEGRAGNDAARFVAIMSGAYAVNQPVEVQHNVQNNLAAFELSPDLREYIDKVSAILGEDVIEGETNETAE